MKLSRLHGRKVAAHVLKHGRIFKGKTMIVRWLLGYPRIEGPSTLPRLFLGTFASTKLDKSAVRRNRMRRRCREAVRITVRGEQVLPTVQLLISPRAPSLSCTYGEILADVESLLSILRHAS